MYRYYVFIACVSLLTACGPNVESRGFVQDTSVLETIKPGENTRDDVIRAFGSPSTQNTFGQESWYYITTIRESVAFLKPEVVEQHVTKITFDELGLVDSISIFDKEDSRQIAYVDRETPTSGHGVNFIEETLGNIGRFNKAGGRGPSTASRGGY